MGYERIHKPLQMGVMSPTKLRMKLLGSHGSSKSPGASPSRLGGVDDGDDHLKNSLLPQERNDEGCPKDRSDSSRSRSDASRGGAAHNSGAGSGGESWQESGAGGNFEFHREVRGPAAAGPFFRNVPSKWNDAEKWIAGRHVVHSNPIFTFSKKPGAGRCVAPESTASRGRGAVSAVTELSSSSSKSSSPSSVSWHPPQKKLRFAPAPSTRDVGTEMTPAASQEQSRSGTPAGAATPSLSPLCSVPDSPRGGDGGKALSSSASFSASEREDQLELRLRTRREIAALGLQLGKISIASWASKEEGLLAQAADVPGAIIDDALKTKQFEARATAWEESRKSKLASRYQKKEMKIQEWESCQKLKFEAKMKQAEAKAEQVRARAKQDMARRLSVLSHKVEGKQARVEARRSRQAARLARQVDRIRKTGRAPSRFRRCCTWFFLSR